jgi:ATP synthase protein I
MGVSVAVGAGMGFWLDGKFGTTPWLMMVFVLCGVVAGFKGMIKAAREANRSQR